MPRIRTLMLCALSHAACARVPGSHPIPSVQVKVIDRDEVAKPDSFWSENSLRKIKR